MAHLRICNFPFALHEISPNNAEFITLTLPEKLTVKGPENRPGPKRRFHHSSGQIIIFHPPGFPWNSRGFPLQTATFWGPRSCEVAINVNLQGCTKVIKGLSHEKKTGPLLSMSHPGWLIGIFRMVYEIIPKNNWVGHHPLYNLTNQVFIHCSIVDDSFEFPSEGSCHFLISQAMNKSIVNRLLKGNGRTRGSHNSTEHMISTDASRES